MFMHKCVSCVHVRARVRVCVVNGRQLHIHWRIICREN